MKTAVDVFLADIRQHALFPEFLKALPSFPVPRFKRGKAGDDAQNEMWIFDSGRADARDAIVRFLTGDADANLTENGERNNG